MRLTIKSDAPLNREQLAKAVRRALRGAQQRQKVDRAPRKMDHAALQGAIEERHPAVDRIRRLMVSKLEGVLEDV